MQSFAIDGFREAVVIVTDPAPHLAAWTGTGGWELRHHGQADPALMQAWGCPGEAAQEWLLAHPDCDSGYVRLVWPRHAATRVPVRADDQCWDSGGIFDLNVRVLDVGQVAAGLRNRGWHGASAPVEWDFGQFTVREWLAKGPDNLRLAVIERVAPPLEGFAHIRQMSQVFNSSQIVRDMDRALHFYCEVLGFRNTYHYHTKALPRGPNVFGLPAMPTPVGLHINIVHPRGKMEGSIELVSLTGIDGLDLSLHARPPNPGLAALRLPIRNLGALEQRLLACGVTPEFGARPIALTPYGQVRMLAVRAPDGAWLEFYEPT